MWRLILSASPPRRCCVPRAPLTVNTTIGTDGVVLARAANLSLNINELWVAFGGGKNFRLLLLIGVLHHIGNHQRPFQFQSQLNLTRAI